MAYRQKSHKDIQDLDSLLRYGAWYLGRYSVSRKRMEEKLFEKTSHAHWVESVMNELAPYMNDEREIHRIVEQSRSMGVSVRAVKFKLLTKGYAQSDIQSALATLDMGSEAMDRLERFAKDRDAASTDEAKKRLFERLIRRGFSYDEVRRFFRKDEE